MFANARSFDSPVGGWDVSMVLDLSCQFCGVPGWHELFVVVVVGGGGGGGGGWAVDRTNMGVSNNQGP